MTHQPIQIPSAVVEAIDRKWWRDPGSETLRDRLGLAPDEGEVSYSRRRQRSRTLPVLSRRGTWTILNAA